MRSILYIVAAWYAIHFGASLIAPDPAPLSPEDWREFVLNFGACLLGMLASSHDV